MNASVYEGFIEELREVGFADDLKKYLEESKDG